MSRKGDWVIKFKGIHKVRVQWNKHFLQSLPWVIVKMWDPPSVEWWASSDDAVHCVAFVQEELSQVRAILTWHLGGGLMLICICFIKSFTCNSCDERYFPCRIRALHLESTMEMVFLHYLQCLCRVWVIISCCLAITSQLTSELDTPHTFNPNYQHLEHLWPPHNTSHFTHSRFIEIAFLTF